MSKLTVKDVIDGLNEALSLLICAAPNRLLIDQDEYYKRLHALQDKFEEPDEDQSK